MNLAANEFVQSFLLQHVSEPKGGHVSRFDVLTEQLRDLLAASV